MLYNDARILDYQYMAEVKAEILKHIIKVMGKRNWNEISVKNEEASLIIRVAPKEYGQQCCSTTDWLAQHQECGWECPKALRTKCQA